MMTPGTKIDHPEIGGTASLEKMPGHWILAKVGKRVLRPGGLYLTHQLLQGLDIRHTDRVVEFAPGLGMTARLTLKKEPAAYTAIEKDENAARLVRQALQKSSYEVRVADAEATGLEPECATVVYGEAMLTMQTDPHKRRIVKEAHRILSAGGRYAIHEIALTPDHLDEGIRNAIRQDLSKTIHHGVNPLTLKEWEELLKEEGFQLKQVVTAPMALLEVPRIVRDEGLLRSLKILTRVLLNSAIRKRVIQMRSIFKQHRSNMQGFVMILTKT